MAEHAYRDGQVVVADPSGNIGTVAPAVLNEYLARGYTPINEQDMAAKEAARAKQQELESIPSKLDTALRAVQETVLAPVDWATRRLGLREAGAPKLADIGLTPEEVAENTARAKANPLSRGAGEIVGQLAMLKGIGIVGTAAGAGRIVAGAGRIVASAVTAGVEGAGIGAMAAMQEDPDATAEHVAASGALMALLGGATGGVFSAAHSGLAKVFGTRASTEAGAELQARAAQSIGAAAEGPSALQKVLAKVSGIDSETLAEVTRRAPEAMHAAEKLPGIINRAAIDLQPVITDLESNVTEVTKHVRATALKEEGLRKIAGEGYDTEARRIQCTQLLRDAHEGVQDVLAGVESVESPIPGAVKNQLSVMQRTLKQAVAYAPDKDAIGLYSAANGVKQTLDDTVVSLRKSALNRSLLDPEVAAIRKSADGLQHIADNTRQLLEDRGIWGSKVAGAQRDVNAVWSSGAIKAMNDFGHQYMVPTGVTDYATGRMGFEADPAKLASTMNGFGTANKMIPERALADYQHHVGKLLDTIGERYELDSSAQAALERARGQLGQMSVTFDSVRSTADIAEKWAKVQAAQQTFAKRVSAVPLGFAGTAAALGPETWVGAAAKVQAAREAIGSMTGGLQTWLARGAEAGARVRTAGMAGALDIYRAQHATDADAYDDRSKRVLAFDLAALGEHLDGMPPAVAAATGAQAMRAVSFLRDQLPPHATSLQVMAPTRKIAPSAPEQQKFARAWSTVVNPASALADLRAGRMTPVQAAALQTVYPRIYQGVRLAALQGIAQADAAGKPLPIHVRQQLDVLLELGGAGESAFSDRITDIVQAGMQRQSQPQQSRGRKTPHLSRSAESSATTLMRMT
jgi:hypothetical protein